MLIDYLRSYRRGDSDEDIDEESVDETQSDKPDISKRKKIHSSPNHSGMVSHHGKRKDVSDSIRHPFARELDKQKKRSEMKDDMNPLRNVHKLAEYDDFMDDFLNDKVSAHARMTSQIRSTLKTLESKISNKRRVILETDKAQDGES